MLEVDPSSCLETEISEWTRLMDEGGVPDAAESMGEFQEWLRQIPGIDEATAISNVITFIEEDKYDVVVFDTAPTGHTLKLLQLPQILSQGMEKLQSWNTTLWTYWDVMQGSTTAVDTKHAMEIRLQEYKLSMDKIGKMLTDHTRTHFVTVCIAEYLSVMETQRLLEELTEKGVRSGIVICNQLLPLLESEYGEDSRALRLIRSRGQIQRKYLATLHQLPGVRNVVEIELQDREVTGIEGLAQFASMLMEEPSDVQTFSRYGEGVNFGGRGPLYPELAMDSQPKVFPIGLTVEVFGLGKTPQYNGALGEIRSYDEKTERYGVFVENLATQMNVRKLLALKPANLRPLKHSTSYNTLLEDANIKEYLQDPRIWDAYMDVKKDPTKIKKYMEDPHISLMLENAAKKIRSYREKSCSTTN